MTPPRITKKQLELLSTINGFILNNGFSPTLADLRKEKGASSDQAVIEILDRLEKPGLISRDPSQARTIRLTDLGKSCLPPSHQSSNENERLSNQQQEVARMFSILDPSLKLRYLAAIRTLNDIKNTDRVLQAAHSLRQITYFIRDLGKKFFSEEYSRSTKEDKNIPVMAPSLKLSMDPKTYNTQTKGSVYQKWNDYHTYFCEVAHDNDGGESPEKFSEQLANYEKFLLTYIFPYQQEIYVFIDEVLSRRKTASPENLRLFLTTNEESKSYFFRKADESWFNELESEGFLNEPTIEVLSYLQRMASKYPKEVSQRLKSFRAIRELSWIALDKISSCFSAMPKKYSNGFIDIFIKFDWLSTPQAKGNVHFISIYLTNLINEGSYNDAIRLASYLFGHRTVEDDENDPVADYEYNNILEALSKTPDESIWPIVEMLTRKLEALLKKRKGVKAYDGSFFWRPSIEDSSQNWGRNDLKNALISSIRDLAGRYTGYAISQNKLDVKQSIEKLFIGSNYVIFRRLLIHIYTIHQSYFSSEIQDILVTDINKADVWHEYALLLQESYPTLPKKTQTAILALITQGPETDNEFATKDWKARRLFMIKPHLNADEKQRYETTLMEKVWDFDPSFLSYHRSYSGPNSPFSKVELLKLPPKEVIACVLGWTPNEDRHFTPSPDGLGMEFQAVVKERAKEFASLASSLFHKEGIQSVYVYYFIKGIEQALKEDVSVELDPVLELIDKIIKADKSNELAPVKDLGRDNAWDGTMQSISSFLETVFAQKNKIKFSWNKKIILWLEHLTLHPTPTSEYEDRYGGDNMDPYTMSLNTPRGVAYHAVFQYVFWHYRHSEQDKHSSKAYGIPALVKDILSRGLDIETDRSLTIRSVYGRHFPWILSYDFSWAVDMCSKIFSHDKPGNAAWESYLLTNISPEAFRVLHSRYLLSIKEIAVKRVEEGHRPSIGEKIAEHIIIGLIFNLDGSDELLLEFFRYAAPEYRAHAISFLGRSYIHGGSLSKNAPPMKAGKLEEFWNVRLEKSEATTELREFGWWLKVGTFNHEWMLEMLNKTLTKTSGDIEADFQVMRTLKELAPDFPFLCIKAVDLMLRKRRIRSLSFNMYEEELKSILYSAFASKDHDTKRVADKVVDHLTRMGFENYRHIPSTATGLVLE